MAKTGGSVELEGVNQVLFALRRTDKRIQVEVTRASGRIATMLANDVKRSATRTRQGIIAARSIRVRKGLVPKVAFGGSGVARPKRKGEAKAPRAYEIFFGAEFGGGVKRGPGKGGTMRNLTNQFPPYVRHGRGGRGYFLYPTLRSKGYYYAGQWFDAVDKAIAREWHQ